MEKIEDGNRCGKLYKCLVSMIELLQEAQKKIEPIESCMSKLRIAKEYGTIKLCSARGSGHTSAIAKIIEDKFNKVVLIVPTMKQYNVFIRNNPSIKEKISVASPESFDRLYGISDVDAVIVDCSSLMSQTKIEELYGIMMYSMKKPMFIFME